MTYTLADVLDKILTAIQDTLYHIADAIATNASTIATCVVVGGLAFMVYRYGSRIFRAMTGMFTGLMP